MIREVSWALNEGVLPDSRRADPLKVIRADPWVIAKFASTDAAAPNVRLEVSPASGSVTLTIPVKLTVLVPVK